MKTKLLMTCIASVSLIATQPAFAERTENQQALLEGSTFTSVALAGAVAGGPIGAIVGAISGAYLAKQTRSANDNEIALQEQEQLNANMEQTLMKNEQHIAQMQQELAQKLTFQVLFATGEDTLNELDIQRVDKLASYLLDNPSLKITLEGHTDIRGTDEYNNVLSQERAKAVKTALVAKGVEESRIKHQGLGASFAKAEKGNQEGYTKDRKVLIDIFNPTEETSAVAQH